MKTVLLFITMLLIFIAISSVMTPKKTEVCTHPSTMPFYKTKAVVLENETLPISKSTIKTIVKKRCTVCWEDIEE